MSEFELVITRNVELHAENVLGCFVSCLLNWHRAHFSPWCGWWLGFSVAAAFGLEGMPSIDILCLFVSDVIWVILSVEVGGLLGVTQQLSSFETEFNTQPHRKVEGNFNPFASPQKNRQSDENNLKDPGGSGFDSISKNTWAPAPDQTEQDENRLSQNSVNLSPSSHANNLSVVTYSKVGALGEEEKG